MTVTITTDKYEITAESPEEAAAAVRLLRMPRDDRVTTDSKLGRKVQRAVDRALREADRDQNAQNL